MKKVIALKSNNLSLKALLTSTITISNIFATDIIIDAATADTFSILYFWYLTPRFVLGVLFKMIK